MQKSFSPILPVPFQIPIITWTPNESHPVPVGSQVDSVTVAATGSSVTVADSPQGETSWGDK